MEKREQLIGRFIKIAFIVCTAAIIVYFIWGEFVYERETDLRNTQCVEYSDGWCQVMQDGSSHSIVVPGEYDAGEDNIFVARNQLPAEVDDDEWVCFRTAKQDVEIYVGDELRKTYTTEGKRPFGTFSVSMYVFVDLEPGDAGKTITYRAYSSDDSRAGIMRKVHYGDRFAIWLHLIMVSGLETVLTFFLLLVGVASVIIMGIINIRYKKNIEVQYLCWGVMLVAIWLIGRSDIRQLFFPNVTVVNSMTYFTIMIAPVPFLIYVDGIQEHRYRKKHMVAAILCLIDFAFCTVLQVTGVRDLMDMSLLIFIGIIVAFVVICVTFFQDYKAGYLKRYKLVATGFAGIIVAVLVQIIAFYNAKQVSQGAVVAIGVMFLLLMATIKSIMDLLRLERQKQEAVVASDAKAKFLASISHEIRTPINAVLGMDEMILRESTENNIIDYAYDIRNAGKTLLSLVNDVLDMSKIESGKMNIIPTEYEVYKLIDTCYNLVAINAQEKGLELEVTADESLPKVLYGDEVRIRQIISNLLTNAVKYTNEGAITFKVGFRELDTETIMLNIMVSDTGIGISKESQEILFDAFERFDDNNTRYIEGTGLGLNIVKQLIELMDGTISVHSEYGAGSVFAVFIPQKVIDSESMGAYEPEQLEDAAIYEYKEMFTAPEANVLVVDDIPMNIKVFRGLLKSTGISIDSAESGEECLKLVEKNKYDVIFLDHIMPKMDGIQVLGKMKQLKNNPNEHTPVIMLTANALSGAREEYARCGFDDYLTKPMRHTELERILLKYISDSKLFDYNSHYTIEAIESNPNIAVMKLEPTQTVKEEIRASVSEFEFLDVDLGLSYCCNDEQFYLEMVRLFAYGDKLDVMQEEYDVDDWENYRLQVHSLKSTSLTIGAVELNQHALEMENAIKQEEYLYVHRHHKELMEEYKGLINNIKRVFEGND